MKWALAFGKTRFLSRPGTQAPFLAYHQRPFSSNALAIDEEPEVNPGRPRLESLRQRLQKEQGSPVFVTRSQNDGANKKKAIPEDQPEKTLENLLANLEDVPMPNEPLTDTFGRQHSYLRISLSERCNLRCQYCMPEDGVPLQPQSNLLSNEEVVRIAAWFVKNGVTKVRLTGGEPLLRKDLVQLVSDLNDLGLEQIGMTTNGVTLSKQLPDLVAAGMTHVNISMDSLLPERFAKLTRRPAPYHAKVMQAIEDCAKLLPNQTKINCVVLPDNVKELQGFCELTRDMPIDVRFIEYMPFNANEWETDGFVNYQQMKDEINGLTRLEDGPNDTTKWWTLPGNTLGRIGFITSMSEHFCGTCNRLRITADGQLKVCLFGKTEVSLRDLMRQGGSEEMLQKVIHHSVQKKHFKLGGHKDMEDLQAHSSENRPMILIGG
jgi:molybdenum cofactor biosynthesis protein A